MSTRPELGGVTLDEVLRHSIDGLFVIDRDRKFVLFSDACERITGYDRASMIGTQCPCHDVTECRDQYGRSLSGTLCPSLSVFRGELPSARQRMSLEHRDGHRVWIETTYSPIHDVNGDVGSILGIMRDITDIKDREEELREATERIMMNEHKEAPTRAGGAEHEPLQWRGRSMDTEGEQGSLDRILTTIEKREIIAALKRADGQRTLAARLLGISRSRLYRRMEALGIDPRQIGPGEEV